MSLKDRIRQEAESGGFRPHPIGTFPGSVIEEVREREHDGQTIYEVCARTSRGIAKMAIWKTVHADIQGRLADLNNGDEAAAEDSYVKTMGRLCRLYSDLGCGDPSTEEGIETEDELETAIYENLGMLVGRECTVVVQANPQKPESPRVYINAPTKGQAAPRGNGGGQQRRQAAPKPQRQPAARNQRQAPATPRSQFGSGRHESAFEGAPPPSLDDIPFMRRMDE